MSNILISQEMLNKVLRYLGTRPYQEVFTLIGELQADLRLHNHEETPTTEGDR